MPDYTPRVKEKPKAEVRPFVAPALPVGSPQVRVDLAPLTKAMQNQTAVLVNALRESLDARGATKWVFTIERNMDGDLTKIIAEAE